MKPMFRIRGDKPERWVAQTNFDNDEAVGYLADRLDRLGIEKALFEAGAVPGDAVVFGDDELGVVFDWEPTMTTGAEHLSTPASLTIRQRHPCEKAKRLLSCRSQKWTKNAVLGYGPNMIRRRIESVVVSRPICHEPKQSSIRTRHIDKSFIVTDGQSLRCCHRTLTRASQLPGEPR